MTKSTKQSVPDQESVQHCSPADAGLDLDFWYIENILTDYDSQHFQTSESS